MRRLGRRLAAVLMGVPGARDLARRLTIRGLVPAAVWNRLPVSGLVAVGLPGGGEFSYAGATSDTVTRQLHWRGLASPEGATVTQVARLARGCEIVVDVGAHIGLYTVVACVGEPRCRVIAFEPVSRNRDLLAEQLARNDVAGRCVVRPEALTDEIGMGTLSIPRIEEGSANPVGGSLHPFREAGATVQVTRARGDDIVFDEGRVGLIKLDVEGEEAAALAGLHRTLERDLPALIVESLPESSPAELESLLDALGYRYFRITPDGLRRSDTLAGDPTRALLNFACLHRTDARAD